MKGKQLPFHGQKFLSVDQTFVGLRKHKWSALAEGSKQFFLIDNAIKSLSVEIFRGTRYRFNPSTPETFVKDFKKCLILVYVFYL